MLFTKPTLDVHRTPLEITITLLWRKPKDTKLPALEPLFDEITRTLKKQGPQFGCLPRYPWAFQHRVTEHTNRDDSNVKTTWVTHSIVWRLNLFVLFGSVEDQTPQVKRMLHECRDLINNLMVLYPWDVTYRTRELSGVGDHDITLTHKQMMKLLTQTRMTEDEYDWFQAGTTRDGGGPHALQRLTQTPPTLSKRSRKQRAENMG